MAVQLTILTENCVERVHPYGLLAEHGFACHLQTEEGAFLFDTGGGQTLINNAERLQIDLSSLQGIILSHGHFDHTGGLVQALDKVDDVPVYAHTELFRPHFSTNGGVSRNIGLPWSREELETLGARFELSDQPREIRPGMHLSGTVPRVTEFETGDPNLTSVDAHGESIPDPLHDDLSLFLSTPKGLVILLGCAHAGLVNIIEHALQVTGEQRIHMIVGGTHLKFSDERQMGATLERLSELDIARIGTSHCTGLRGARLLAECFGERFFNASVGVQISV